MNEQNRVMLLAIIDCECVMQKYEIQKPFSRKDLKCVEETLNLISALIKRWYCLANLPNIDPKSSKVYCAVREH